MTRVLSVGRDGGAHDDWSECPRVAGSFGELLALATPAPLNL